MISGAVPHLGPVLLKLAYGAKYEVAAGESAANDRRYANDHARRDQNSDTLNCGNALPCGSGQLREYRAYFGRKRGATWLNAINDQVAGIGAAEARMRWWVLATAGLAQLMVVLDSTVITIALPSLQQDLDLSDAGRSWVISAYALAFGGLLLPGGRLTDTVGARRSFVLGLSGFALAGAAPTMGVLFAGRGAQGAFAALLAPAALAIISATFTQPRERGIAFGVYGALTGAGAVIGLLLGGILTQYLDWRWCLLINIPITGIALLGARMVITASPTRRARLDPAGAASSIVGMTAVVFALTEVITRGWHSPLVLALLAIGIVTLIGFTVVQTRVAHPLLPLRILLDRSRGGAFLAIGLPQLALFGFFLVLTYWFQQLLGYTPIQAGLAFLPLAVAIAIGSTAIAGALATRLAPRTLIVPALLVMASGITVLIGLEPDTSGLYLTRFLPAEILIGLGLGCAITPAVAIATTGVRDSDTGAASATVNAITQLGGSIGTALLNTIAASVTAAVLATPTSDIAELTQATVAGFDAALISAAMLLLVAAATVALVMPRRRSTGSHTELDASTRIEHDRS